MIKYSVLQVNNFFENCSIIYDSNSLDAAILDPGGSPSKIKKIIDEKKLNVKFILLTHGHLDHIGAAKELADELNVEILGPHIEDKFLFDLILEQHVQLNLPRVEKFYPNKYLNDNDELLIGSEKIKVLHCPGHTPGHVVFSIPSDKICFVGDVIFENSIGRTDFPRGNFGHLISSIKNKIFTLDPETLLIPGHGGFTSVENEIQNNPYVN